MGIYNKYLVRNESTFNEEDYPKVAEELRVLKEGLASFPPAHLPEVIISYLKSHSIEKELAEANPKLAEAITSNIYATDHLEGLFGACKENKVFEQSLEAHMKKQLLRSTITF